MANATTSGCLEALDILTFVPKRAGLPLKKLVASAVASRLSTADALKYLGITPFEDGGEMLELLTQLRATGKVDWDELWIAMRGSGVQLVHEAFDEVLDVATDGVALCVDADRCGRAAAVERR